MQKWQKGIINIIVGLLFAYWAFDSYGYDPLWMTEFQMLCTLLMLGAGAWDLFAPATMLTCPKCGIKTRHYPAKSKKGPQYRAFKCDVCGNKGILSAPKAPRTKSFCINCGKEQVTESKFCPDCGANQSENTAKT